MLQNIVLLLGVVQSVVMDGIHNKFCSTIHCFGDNEYFDSKVKKVYPLNPSLCHKGTSYFISRDNLVPLLAFPINFLLFQIAPE